MNAKTDQWFDPNLDAIIPGVMSSGNMPQELTENELWDYALGLLDLDHQEQFLRRLACSSEAQNELTRIYKSLALGPSVSVIESVRQRAIQLLERLALAAVIVKIHGRLIAVRRAAAGGETPSPEVRRLGGKGESGPVATEPGDTVEVPAPEGLRVRAILCPGERIDIHIETSAPHFEGQEVTLSEMLPAEKGESRFQQFETQAFRRPKQENGLEFTATFEDCPAGILKLTFYGGREILVCLELPEP